MNAGYPLCFALGILFVAVVTVSDFHSSGDCTMEIEQKTELRRRVIESLADAPKSTKALMDQFADLGDRPEASAFLGGMYRDALIRKQSNSYWKATTKGLRYVETPGIVEHEHKAPSEQEETGAPEGASQPASELVAAKQTIKMQSDMLDDLRYVITKVAEAHGVRKEPHQNFTHRLLETVDRHTKRGTRLFAALYATAEILGVEVSKPTTIDGEGWPDLVPDAARKAVQIDRSRVRGTSPAPVSPPNHDPWHSIQVLQDGIPEGSSLVIEHQSSFAVGFGQQFELKEDGDYQAFVRLAARHMGAVD